MRASCHSGILNRTAVINDMKRYKYALILLLAVLTISLYADIIIVQPSPARICAKIQNLNDFPEIAILGFSDCLALSKSNKSFVVKSNSCMKMYKTCPLSLYAVEKNYLKKIDLNKIDWHKDENVQKLNLTINEKEFNTNDFSSLEVDFMLDRYNDSTLYLYKTQVIYKFKAERPDSVQFFKKEIDPVNPITVSTRRATK